MSTYKAREQGGVPPHLHMQPFVQQYIETALWSSVDDQGNDLTHYDLAPQTVDFLKRDALQFERENGTLLDRAYALGHKYTPFKAGHDFWLTRNRHGVGFWDRDLGPIGKQLTDAAHQWPPVHLYVGDDGLVYAAGHENRANEARRPMRMKLGIAGEARHDAKFERCVQDVKAQRRAVNPWAVCHATLGEALEDACEDCIGIHTHHDVGPETMHALGVKERPSRPGYYAVYPNGRIASGPYVSRGQADDEAKKIRGFVQYEAGEAALPVADEKVSYVDREKLPASAFALPKRRALLLTDKNGNLDAGHVKAAAGRLSMMKHLGHLKPGEWKEAHARILAAGKKVGLKIKEVREAFEAKHEAKEGFAVAMNSPKDIAQADAARHIVLKTPEDIYNFVAPSVRGMSQEVFVVVPMDLHGSPLSPKPFMVAMGQRDRVQVDPGDVIRPLLDETIKKNAAAFVVCHQHPSGRPHPSDADMELTETIREAARVACPSVVFLDHCILGANQIYSFADKKVHKIPSHQSQ